MDNVTNQNKIVFAFIDSQNLNLGIRDQGWKLDFKRFRVYLKDKYKVSKVYLFIGYVPANKKLYSLLKSFGYSLIFKPTVVYRKQSVEHIKGNVDAELVLQVMIDYSMFTKAIIISGDGDFYCLVKYLKQQNKLGRIIVPNRYKYSLLLFTHYNDIDFMNELRGKLERKGNKMGGVAFRDNTLKSFPPS